jgi:hypothetical protein
LKNKIDSLLLLSRQEVNGKLSMMLLWHQLLFHKFVYLYIYIFINYYSNSIDCYQQRD